MIKSHGRPLSEVLLPRTLLSKPTDKLLSALANTGVRIERIDDERFDPELAAHFVENFYASLPMNKGYEHLIPQQ